MISPLFGAGVSRQPSKAFPAAATALSMSACCDLLTTPTTSDVFAGLTLLKVRPETASFQFPLIRFFAVTITRYLPEGGRHDRISCEKKDSARCANRIVLIADFPATQKGCQGQPEREPPRKKHAAAEKAGVFSLDNSLVSGLHSRMAEAACSRIRRKIADRGMCCAR
jgi:hypothetical protein